MGDSPADTVHLQALLDQGDENAYAELLSIASNRLRKLARKMLRDFPRLRRWEQTDDVFQTAAMRLHRSLSEVQPESVRQFFGLAATQIRRTLIDLARHHYGPEGHAVKHRSGLEASGDGPLDELPDDVDSPETLASWAEFHEAVGNMPPDEREVFDLIWYSGATHQQVAELLQISERTVFRRYYRAKLHLGNYQFGDNGQGA